MLLDEMLSQFYSSTIEQPLDKGCTSNFLDFRVEPRLLVEPFHSLSNFDIQLEDPVSGLPVLGLWLSS